MKLEILLKMLAASNADELMIEPETKARLVSASENTEIAETVFSAANVSQLIFPIIPLEDKLRLSSLPQITFRYTNELGLFGVNIAKSPTGLAVGIKKINVPTITLPPDFKAHSASTASPVVTVNTAVISKPIVTTSQFVSANADAAAAPPSSFSNSAPSGELPGLTEPFTEEFEETLVSTNPLPPALSRIFSEKTNGGHSLINQSSANEIADNEIADEASDNSYVPAQNSVVPKMDALFYKMAEAKASDLHLSVSIPPMIRQDGKIKVLDEEIEPMTPAAMRDLLLSIMPEKNREEFERRHDTDFAYEIKGLARFRANVFMDRKGMGGVFRIIPSKILTAEQLGLSTAILNLCNLNKGLVVVTGPTGSGKSTTLCAMLDYVNRNRTDHIITIEDPIEFVHENQQCLLNQREVHNHTDSFKDALRAALREDPDILLVGEMRDLETVSIAIETAETGHLVFGTLHTTTAASTVDRIIDQFPADRQQQIRVMLSESLKGVIAQTLLPKKGGGRIAALEVLIITPAISNLIREGKTFQIPSAMQTGKQHGMMVLNDSLMDLVTKGLVEPRDAYLKAVDKSGIEALFKRNEISMVKYKEVFESA